MKFIDGGICTPKGFKANGIHAGIRHNQTKKDLSLIISDTPCHAVATYTQNKVKGAPLLVTKEHLENGIAKAVICNSGNANTCNSNGIEIAEGICELLSKETGIDVNDIIVASTGVIGQPLSLEPFETHMKELVEGVSVNGGHDATLGIMTTDTVPKEFAVEFEIDGKTGYIGAIAKGSGMIHPNMATMLAFVTSDVVIDTDLLQSVVKEIVDDTFNMVSVDGDTSTNDMLTVLCNGESGIEITKENVDIFYQALKEICIALSKAIAKDGEGATKLLMCHVVNGYSIKDSKVLAKSVITSSLLKAAMFGKDANWGRILCALGYADAYIDVNKVNVTLSSIVGDILVCENGQGVDFDEDEALKILTEDEITILVDCQLNDFEATAWGCDLTYDYVKINGDYRT